MTLSKQSQAKKSAPAKTKTTPPLLIGLAGLLVAVGFACFLGLTGIQNEKVTREALNALQTMWSERVKSTNYADQDKVDIDVQQDRLKLAVITDGYRQLYQLISIAATGLAVFSLLYFLAFRMGILLPLRKLEKSSRELLANDLNGHIWGLDRNDAFGSLARSIADIRKATVDIADMVVKTENGEQHIRFEGHSADVFGALIADLQKTVENLTQHSATLEVVSKNGQESVLTLGEITTKQAKNLEQTITDVSSQFEETITNVNQQVKETLAGAGDELKQAISSANKQLDETISGANRQLDQTLGSINSTLSATNSEWADKLSTLFHQNNQIQGQSKQMVDQFTKDMQSLNEIAAATGGRVAQTLHILSTSEKDFKKSAQLSLQASTTFTAQANDLTEKLQSATNLLRASGKVMSETTETARTRLNEAINSVAGHDQAIRAFLGDTEEKTDRITSLLEDVSRSAVHASETVSTFDQRMALFEEKSNTAFGRIDDSGDAIATASVQLTEADNMMRASLEGMNGHTEFLARILTSIRDEYESFSTEWKTNIAETVPVFTQLKEASNTLQVQLRDEWSVYAQQSRQLLTALEQDVRAMNTRTEQVTRDTEKVIEHLTAQTQRIGDNANHFDLHVANITMRLDEATSSVIHSNRSVVETTAAQIQTIHNAVGDMAQRLSILSQLTGTLGAVAGQLGQIVPALSEAQNMQKTPIAASAAAGNDPVLLAKFEEISAGFSNTVGSITTEFDGVRQQIGKWVEMLTSGYKNLAEQINTVDGSIEKQLAAIKEQVAVSSAEHISAAAAMASVPPPPAPTINLGEELVPAMRLIHEGLEKTYAVDAVLVKDLQQLKGDLQSMAKDVQSTSGNLQNLGTLVEQGFDRIEEKESKPIQIEPIKVNVDASRVETAVQSLEQLLRKLQGQSDTATNKLGDISQRLEGTSAKLQNIRFEPSGAAPAPASTAPALPPITFSEKANLDQLQLQIENIAAMLDKFSADGAPENVETLTPDKSKAFIDTVMATIIRLHHIAESIEKVGGNTPPSGGQDSKTG